MMRFAIIAIFAAFGLIAVGLFALLAFDTVIAYDVTCSRSSDSCVLEQERLTEVSRRIIPLHTIESATIELWHGGRGRDSRVLLMLVGADQRHFAAEYEGWNAQENAAAAVRDIVAFIADSGSPELKLEVSNPILYATAWIGGVLCLLLIVGGAIAALRGVGKRGGTVFGDDA